MSASNSIEARFGHGPSCESVAGIVMDWQDRILLANDPVALKQEQGDASDHPPLVEFVVDFSGPVS